MVIIWLMMANHNLVGGFNSFKHLDKYEFVRWDDEIPNIWKIIKNSSTPPTSDSHIWR
jgi:hypothetical protein